MGQSRQTLCLTSKAAHNTLMSNLRALVLCLHAALRTCRVQSGLDKGLVRFSSKFDTVQFGFR